MTDSYGLCKNKYTKPNNLSNDFNILYLINKYPLKYIYYDDFNLIKIDISNLDIRFDLIKRFLKILAFEAQYKYIEKNTIVLEILEKDIILNEFLILLNIMKLTKTLHYFKIKIKKDSNISLDKQTIDILNYIKSKYIGLSIK